jgi:hypothetical protein
VDEKSPYSFIRRIYIKELSRDTKKSYAYAINALSGGAADPLSPAVKAGLRRYAIVQARIVLRDRWIDVPTVFALALFAFGLLVDIGGSLSNAEHVSNPTGKALIGGPLFFVFTYGIALNFPKRLEGPVAWLLFAALCTGALYLRDPSMERPWHSIWYATSASSEARSFAYAMFMATSLFILMQGVWLISSIVRAATTGRLVRRYPNVQILFTLLVARKLLGVHPNRLANQSTKNAVEGLLHGAAAQLERDMPKFIGLPNGYQQDQLKQRFAESAAGIRLMSLRLALSDDSTQSKIRDEVTDLIQIIAVGDYGLLPKCELPPRATWARKMITVCRNLVVAFIPLAAAATARYAGLRFSSGFENWVIAVSLIWAVITVISLLDPHYESKIANLRDLVSIFNRKVS